MSKVLLIRHLPIGLSFHEKEQLLKHFGAEKVWEVSSKRNYLFSSFPTIEKASASLHRLHQLEIAQRRLVVEYSQETEPNNIKNSDSQISSATLEIKEFLRLLNAWNLSVDFYQPPPVNLKYKYPSIEPNTVINIIYALYHHNPFYTQTLHLMNKMTLNLPFQEKMEAVDFFKNIFKPYFKDEFELIQVPSEPESELSSDECELKNKIPADNRIKRKHLLPVTRKRPAAVLSTAVLPKQLKIKPLNQDKVFEPAPLLKDTKKISLVVSQDALQKKAEEPFVIGSLGMFQKEEPAMVANEVVEETRLPTITKKELLKNRISYSDMKVLPVYKNYHPGEPSMRIYIKNLAKSVTAQDIESIYRRYIQNVSSDQQIGFDVRVMQEGRMKGQAFITFPSVQLAETALNETNGYMLKDKPLVVQFARAAIKKCLD